MINFVEQSIAGCFLVEMAPKRDERGFFAKAFSDDVFSDRGLEASVSQLNYVESRRGVIRGIHWQEGSQSEAKLIRCVRGRVFDVCVDVRPDSATFGAWVGVELTAENMLSLYIPPGCGHAYQALEPETVAIYSSSAPFNPEAEMGARWDDPVFSIEWPLNVDVIVSAKDRAWPDFRLDV